MADSSWSAKMVKMLKPLFYLILIKGFLGITDHEFAILFKQTLNTRWRIQDGESKMVDSRRSAKNGKNAKTSFYLI